MGTNKLFKDGYQSNNYVQQLRKVDEKDLKFVEKDLTFYEKVSLTFFLYGNDKINAQYAAQNLMILHRSGEKNSELLINYAKRNKNWRLVLIEALAIIKAQKIIRKLGINKKEIHEIFLPHVPGVSLFVHPLLKALYFICEELPPVEAAKIVCEIRKSNESADSLRFYDTKYLEVFLLDWISKSIISIGDFPFPSSVKKLDINLSRIYECLKLVDLNYDNAKDMLEYSTKRMYEMLEKRNINEKQKPPNIRMTKEMLNRNENDSALTVKNENFGRKDSFAVNHDEYYIIRKESAGFILIINQEDFYRDSNPELQELLPNKELPKRRGTAMDKVRLEELFSSFGYRVFIKNNLTHIQILEEIDDIVNRSAIFDSLIVCILSHGIEGAVYGSNSIPLEIQKIQKNLASEKLLGKPKLLIIQACQGEDLQIAKVIKNLEYDSPQSTSSSSAPAFSDMLTATSTVPGFASIRHIEKGTWFIQTLCKLIDIQADRKHLLDILTSVIKEVSIKRGNDNQCMVPQTYTTLSKHFYLPRRL